MTHEPNTECVRRILYLHGIVSAVILTDQETAAVNIILEQGCSDKGAIAAELKDWCGFQFTVYDTEDADRPAYQRTLRDGARFLVSPGV